MGAGLAARRYSKEFELEADLIGTRIAFAAGYDPVLGAAFFDRLPDPGDRFLGTHPANASRKTLVQRETARLRSAR
jgi:predicted Zn-dependent protease